MILGLFLGLMAGLIILIVFFAIGDNSYYLELLFKGVGLFLLILCTLLGGFIGKDIHQKKYDMRIRNWNNSKMVIEESIKNEDISDLEKINLVKTITQYNMQLENLKTEVTYWWNWYLDDSKVNELEIIVFK